VPRELFAATRLAGRAVGGAWRAAALTRPDKKLYRRQIEATDAEIDALVYELYGLTEEEMIVEGRSAEWDEGTGHPPT
jgi:hypothetical protein